MSQVSGTDVPDLGRRQFMNLLTFGTITGVAAGALYPIVKYFIPPRPVVRGAVSPLKMP